MSINAVIMFFYYQIMHLLGLFNTAGAMNMHACCFMKSVMCTLFSKMPSIITIYGADIEILTGDSELFNTVL